MNEIVTEESKVRIHTRRVEQVENVKTMEIQTPFLQLECKNEVFGGFIQHILTHVVFGRCWSVEHH